MTHPDILKMERDGYLYEDAEIGDCLECDQCIEYCDMRCMRKEDE